MADQKGTGKHPHKSAEEPFPHTKDSAGGGAKSHSTGSKEPSDSRRSGESRGSDDKDDLKQREYKDDKGNVHHHTRAKSK